MAVAAYVLGARVIEKHFTLNRAWKGTDHAFSLEPVGLRKMVRDLDRTWQAMGDGEKRVYPSEVAPITKMGKKARGGAGAAGRPCARPEDVRLKSPGDGLPPYELEKVIGATLLQPLNEDDEIAYQLLKRTPELARS